MKNHKLFIMGSSLFCLACLTIIFSNLAVTAESYTEPPILHKEIELKQQSEAKKAREEAARQAAREAEQKRMAEEQKRMAEKREKLKEAREAEEKRMAEERAKKQAELEAEAKRIAEQEAEKKRTEKSSYMLGLEKLATYRVNIEHERGFRIGMTENELIMIWGPPTKVNITKTINGISKQIIYRPCEIGVDTCESSGHSTDKYIYSENGIITSIQSSR